nr:retrotransposon Gag domain, retroviral aspartyl protease [Tanacetum cinerariifolium]
MCGDEHIGLCLVLSFSPHHQPPDPPPSPPLPPSIRPPGRRFSPSRIGTYHLIQLSFYLQSLQNLSFGSIAGIRMAPATRNSTNQTDLDPIAAQLAAIAARLESMETLKEDVAALKSHVEIRGKSHNDMERVPGGHNITDPLQK